MCLIFVNKDDQKFSRKALLAAHRQNGDGTGMLLWNGSEWIVKKTMSPKITEILDQLGGYSRVCIHFRWATHGVKDESNVHPFDLGHGWWVMHNGVLPFTPSDKTRSDTWQFAEYLKGIGFSKMGDKQRRNLWPLLNEVIGRDRVLFASPDGTTYRLGTWVEKPEGYYSNSGCLTTYASNYTKKGNTTGYYAGRYITDDDLADYVTGWDSGSPSRTGHYVNGEYMINGIAHTWDNKSKLWVPKEKQLTLPKPTQQTIGEKFVGGSITSERTPEPFHKLRSEDK